MSKTKNYTSSKGNSYKIAGGVYTGYSFKEEGKKSSIFAFDHPAEVKAYIEERENGNRHHCDLDKPE
jgi:hypothetical protein